MSKPKKTKEELQREKETIEESWKRGVPIASGYLLTCKKIEETKRKLAELEKRKKEAEKEFPFLTHIKGILKSPKMVGETKKEEEEVPLEPPKKRRSLELEQEQLPTVQKNVRKSLEKKMEALKEKKRLGGGTPPKEGHSIFDKQIN